MRLRRIVPACVVFAFVLTSAEAAARKLEPWLSSAGVWPEGAIAEQFDNVSRAAAGERPRVVFAGSSTMHRAIDADLFSAETGRSARNLALLGAKNQLTALWVRDVVVPVLDPGTVVIGMTTLEFDDAASLDELRDKDALTLFRRSPGFRQFSRRTWLDRADAFASRYSAVVRNRRSLRSLDKVADAAWRRTPSKQPLQDRTCPAIDPKAEQYNPKLNVRRAHRRLPPYAAGGRETRALIEAINEVKAKGMRVVLLRLPFTRDQFVRRDMTRAHVRAFERAFDRVAAKTDVPVIEAPSFRDERYFRDPIHLNCAGKERFTTMVARAWERIEGSGVIELREPPS